MGSKTTPTKVPGFPKPPSSVTIELRRYLETLVEAIEIRLGRRGDPRDRAVTLRELIDSGLAKQLRSSPFDPNQGGPIDFSPPDVLDVVDVPPQPTGFTVAGAFSVINLTWDYPSYSNHNQTEIWSHTSNVLGSATIAGVSTGQTFIDPVGSGKTVYYWIRHVNTAGLTGPWNSTTGTVGQTATDVAHMLDVLTGAITSSELATALATPIGNLPANTQTEINTLTGRINDVNDIAAWAASTSYSVDDLVIHSSKRYRALQNHTSSNSNQPSGSTSDNAYWKYIGADSTVTIEQMFLINARTEDDVDHLDGQYTVKIDANGHVAGFGLANTTTASGTNTSEFFVNADRFAILPDQRAVANTEWSSSATFGVGAVVSHTSTDFGTRVYYAKVASNSSNPQAPVITVSGNQTLNSTYWYDLSVIPFAVQAAPATASDGTVIPPGVYMNMASIKYASIEAAKIGSVNADTINAGTLDVSGRITAGDIQADKLDLQGSVLESQTQTINGTAQPTLMIKAAAITTALIDDAQVTTLKINGQAVTIPSSSFNDGGVSGQTISNTGAYSDLVTLTYTSTGNPVVINASTYFKNYVSDEGASYFYRLIRGTSTVLTEQNIQIGAVDISAGSGTMGSIAYLDTTTSTGSRTYTIQARRQSGNGNISAFNKSLTAVEIKR
jgi:hypothetical protein